MTFSKFAWQLYRDSEQGRTAIERNVPEHAATIPVIRDVPQFEYNLWLVEIQNDKLAGDWIQNADTIVNIRKIIREDMNGENIRSLDEAEALFTSIADDGLTWEIEQDGKPFALCYGGGAFDHQGYSDIYASIEGLTAGLHECFPEYFFPYLFARRFDELQKICDRYGIFIPEIPGKRQKRERALYYLPVNRAFQQFRIQNELSPSELNAFLYDFAPKDRAETYTDDLPSPSRIWFVMGGKNENGDYEYLDNATGSAISYWQGNLETRRGDIVLLWCVSPRSCLHSIWRALDTGFNDPYFYYYTVIRIGKPINIPPVKFKDFSQHPFFKNHPAVKARFQGRGGMAFSVQEYKVINDMICSKGFSVEALPDPPEEFRLPDVVLTCERDVEIYLVEPFLKQLGFTEQDWRYQLRIRMGRGERNVPDYVLGVDDHPGEERAVALIECKLDIFSKKERKDAFLQAKSYALRLQSKILALMARQGVWIFRNGASGFDEHDFLFKNWIDLKNPDKIAEISSIMGQHAIEAEFMDIKRKQARFK